MNPARSGMPREGRGLQVGGGGALHDCRHGPVGQPPGPDVAMAAERPKERTFSNRGGGEPGLQGSYRTAPTRQARDPDEAPGALLVGLGAARLQHDPVRLVGDDVRDVEPDQLAAAEGAHEADNGVGRGRAAR
jgi:hypothetical protein